MNNEKTKYVVLGVLIVCIIGYVYYNYYLKDEIQKISSIKQQIEQKNMKIVQLASVKHTIDNEIKKVKNSSREIDKQIPDVYNQKDIIRYFYDLIKEKGLNSDIITFAESETNKLGYKIVSVSFKISGDYSNVRDFIKTIENSKRKFVIKQCNAGQSENGAWGVSLLIEFYSLK